MCEKDNTSGGVLSQEVMVDLTFENQSRQFTMLTD